MLLASSPALGTVPRSASSAAGSGGVRARVAESPNSASASNTSSATGRSSAAPGSWIVLPPGGWSNVSATSDGRPSPRAAGGANAPASYGIVAAITSDWSASSRDDGGAAAKMSDPAPWSVAGSGPASSASIASAGGSGGTTGSDPSSGVNQPDAGTTGATGGAPSTFTAESPAAASAVRNPDAGPASGTDSPNRLDADGLGADRSTSSPWTRGAGPSSNSADDDAD